MKIIKLITIFFFLNLFILNIYSDNKNLTIFKNIEDVKENLQEYEQALEAAQQKDQNNKIKNPIMAEFVDRIKTVTSFSAKFEQSDNNKNILTGFVDLVRDNKFLWKILTPEREQQSYITNGNKFWHYDVSLSQVVVDNFDKSKVSNSPLYFLLDDINNLDNIGSIYNIAYYDNMKNIYKLELNNNGNYISDLIIYFKPDNIDNKKSNIIEKISFIAAKNNQITINFSEVKINHKIKDNIFNFSVPKGVDVIDAKELL